MNAVYYVGKGESLINKQNHERVAMRVAESDNERYVL